jgi:predicted RNA-binding Zn ribbon-like protein
MPGMDEHAPARLQLGGHRALDFLNTWREPGEVEETLSDGRAFGEWRVAVGHLEPSELAKLKRRFGEAAMDAVAAEARRFREWAREWLTRWRSAPGARYTKELEELNRLLAREDRNRQGIAHKQGMEVREVPAFESAATLVSLPAADIADLLTREDPDLIRECAGDPCTLWFLDRTRSHRRRFCSAAACGNRAKVAAFRERQRE